MGQSDELTFFQYVRYLELSLRYQDTIVGHLFGVSTGFAASFPHTGSFSPGTEHST